MSFTLRQVQPLLTQPELELFQASRVNAVKALTARELTSKVKRARALRDKYRDTYRRQTVATRTGRAGGRAQKGGENARTDVKAEVMSEVLDRFEAQLAKVEAQAGRSAAKPVATKTAAGKMPAKKATTQRAVTKPTATKKTTAKKSAAAKTPAKKAGALGGTAKSAKTAITGAAQPAATLMKQVRSAVSKQAAQAPEEGAPTSRRSIRAKVGGSPSANAQGAVPTNMPARAQRLNPLKAEPVNKKIHASARSRQQATTAKRDAR